MKLVITKNLDNNNCHVQFEIIDVTNEDTEKLKDFGKPVIDVGGTFTLTGGESFKMSNDTKIIPDEFDFVKVLRYIEHKDKTQEFANFYVEEIKNRVATVIAELDGKTDGFSGVEEVQL